MNFTGTQLLQLGNRVRDVNRMMAKMNVHAFTLDELRCAYKSTFGADVDVDALEVLADTLIEHDVRFTLVKTFSSVHTFFDPADIQAIKTEINRLATVAPRYRTTYYQGGPDLIVGVNHTRFLGVALNRDLDVEVATFWAQLRFRYAQWGYTLYPLARDLDIRLHKLGYRLLNAGHSRRGELPKGLYPNLAPFSARHGANTTQHSFGFHLVPTA